MDYVIICIVSLVASGLTLFSGFGLGTILLPVFALFFPIEIAITLTAIVHFLNNLFKLALIGKYANLKIVFQFGIPAILFALIGAYTLKNLTSLEPLFNYIIGNKTFYVEPLKLTIGILLFFFAIIDLIPKLKNIQFPSKYLPLGGVLSGFFGGLSGHQGALRSAFLIRSNLTKEGFIATGVVIACIIDTSRLLIYANTINEQKSNLDIVLISVATLAAFCGAYFGNKLVKKVTIESLQNFVALLLVLFSLIFSAGII
uniref:TSUP family transporter n=1 Tax=Flavobacterium sp. TaxID=239 RepID=UPI004049C46F